MALTDRQIRTAKVPQGLNQIELLDDKVRVTGVGGEEPSPGLTIRLTFGAEGAVFIQSVASMLVCLPIKNIGCAGTISSIALAFSIGV